jgi:hypothetical protein
VVSTGNNAVATAIGGGIDLYLAPFLSFRAIQLDYLMTRFNSSSQNEPRVSTSVVLGLISALNNYRHSEKLHNCL